MRVMRKVLKVKALQGYRLELEFDDGVCGTVDLANLAGKGVFALWRDRRSFEHVGIGSSGELVWGVKVDLCPDSLYLKVTGKRPDEIFPALSQESSHA
jgi:hypothetical protein